jgi:hypothetical protein
MKDYGFRPVGVDIKNGMRTVFVSADGKFILNRNSGTIHTGSYDLIDNNSGVTLVSNIKIGYKLDGTTPHIDNLVAAVIEAGEGNFVNFRIEQNRIEGLSQEKVNGYGLAEWTPIMGANGKKITKGRMFAANNPVYYDFKRKLVNSTGHANAMKILNLMRQELGDQVIEEDFGPVTKDNPNRKQGDATIKWIMEFSAKHHWDLQKMHEEIFKDIRKDEAEARASQMILDAENGGDKGPYEPKRPGRPIMTNRGQPILVHSNENGTPQIDTRESYDIKLQEFAKEEQAARDAEVFGDRTEQNAREALDDLLTWTKTLQNLQGKYEERARNVSPVFNQNVGQAILDKLSELRGEVRTSANLTTAGIWASESGYIIQQMMYPESKSWFGHKVTMRRLGVATPIELAVNPLMKKLGGEPIDIREKITGKKSQPAVFYVYSPKGNLVGTYNSMQEAQEASAKYALEIEKGIRKDSRQVERNFTPKKKR